MKLVRAFLVLAAAAVSVSAREATVDNVGGANHVDLFKGFMEKYNKHHEGAEYERRLSIFKDNIEIALRNQKDDPEAVHGITEFMDLTREEFRERMGLRPVDKSAFLAGAEMGEHIVQDNPDSYDWRTKGAVTQVKNQGNCGSCWTFSTTGCLEGAHFLKTGNLVQLSEQELVDCDHTCMPDEPQACDAGCNGGLPSNAMTYIQENGGIDSEDSYPYEGFNDKCRADPKNIVAGVKNFTIVPPDEATMESYLVNYGPLSIGINADWMQTYMGGVSCPYLCNPQRLDHGVLIVGYGKGGFAPARLHGMDYWIIKNSWGPAWGEEGYIRVCRGQGKCGLNEMVVSVTEAI